MNEQRHLEWTRWHGGDWTGDPDALVNVRFSDGQDDLHMPPSPARNLGLSGEPSNWRSSSRDFCSVVAYALAPRDCPRNRPDSCR